MLLDKLGHSANVRRFWLLLVAAGGVVFFDLCKASGHLAASTNSQNPELRVESDESFQTDLSPARRTQVLERLQQRLASIQNPDLKLFDVSPRTDRPIELGMHPVHRVVVVEQTVRHLDVESTMIFRLRSSGREELVIQQVPFAEPPRVFVIDEEGRAHLYRRESLGCAQCRKFWLTGLSFVQETVEWFGSYFTGERVCEALRLGKSQLCVWPSALALKFGLHAGNLSLADHLAARTCHDVLSQCRYQQSCRSREPLDWPAASLDGSSQKRFYAISGYGPRVGRLELRVFDLDRDSERASLVDELHLRKALWVAQGGKDVWVSRDARVRVTRLSEGSLRVEHVIAPMDQKAEHHKHSGSPDQLPSALSGSTVWSDLKCI